MEKNTVMEVAQDLLALTRRAGFDPTSMRQEITAALQPFVVTDEELSAMFAEHGLEIPGLERSRIILHSPELIFMLSKFGTDFILPIHNHESWNVLLICRGQMHFRWYRRLDASSIDGRARLEVADDLMVGTGEVAFIAPPPHDIHQLAITEADTWMLTVTPQPEPPLREIYDVAAGTYEIQALAVVDVAMV